MSTYTQSKRPSFVHSIKAALSLLGARFALPDISVYGILMIGALFAFESFNYGTTQFALSDLLGSLSFAGMSWATILALAFCGMDVAGILKLFSLSRGDSKSLETWYLLGAWLLAATMNAALTWWAVSLALIGHSGLGNEILGRETLLSSVPAFVAVLVWLLRILIIGAFSMASGRLLYKGRSISSARHPSTQNGDNLQSTPQAAVPAFNPSPKPNMRNGKPQQRPMAARPHRTP